MKKQTMLHVEWNEKESSTYYVDKDKYSTAHKRGSKIILDSFEGNYIFNEKTKEVSLFNGYDTKRVNVKKWKVYEAPAI